MTAPDRNYNGKRGREDPIEDLKFGSGKEQNAHRLETRFKQIQYGKNTIGYDNYTAAVEKLVFVQIVPFTLYLYSLPPPSTHIHPHPSTLTHK